MIRVNLHLDNEDILRTHSDVINECLNQYIAKRGKKPRYTIYCSERQINIHGTGEKPFDGILWLLKVKGESNNDTN